MTSRVNTAYLRILAKLSIPVETFIRILSSWDSVCLFGNIYHLAADIIRAIFSYFKTDSN
jgi:hypothetical protein